MVKEEMIYKEIFENSVEHGRHRASSEGYSLGQILREYILFDKVITVDLMEREAFTKETGMVIKYSIENAMLYSATAFYGFSSEYETKINCTCSARYAKPYFGCSFRCKNDET